jgi:acetoacetate decarboxylase
MFKGKLKGYSMPLHSPLYDESPWEYDDCEAVAAFVTFDETVEELLPEGLEPYSKPIQGGYWISHYPFSTLGEYCEALLVIQVKDLKGNMGYYIPYIYVTNDAALAAGREVVGAPKKLAHIELQKEYNTVMGVLERPKGKRLLTVTMFPSARAEGPLIEAILPRETPLLSLRVIPSLKGGKPEIAQLISWAAVIGFHKDERGRQKSWVGSASVTYDSPSAVDPIHELKVLETITALYFKFDMALITKEVQKSYV